MLGGLLRKSNRGKSPPQIFALPKRGTLNVHDSVLPKYAGFLPLIWALLNDEKEVGVPAHMMDDTLDAGDIVLQQSVPVGPRDTTAVLFGKTLKLFGPVRLRAV
ncbi:formyl transferase-like protein [Lentzea flaviverrucosa]|uniref:Methionyl-tRNA formyltransferase n=1 Tax=Lentzea flaviverrucosa TaxID=200379 RepID=A0A1H9BB71_9PSEU|nr:formyl transferase-like protein [Lentzea flaviverrucosa]SEP85951.1 methionyl-tRNA formyltransferase [Lentzea flaviverrucosa]